MVKITSGKKRFFGLLTAIVFTLTMLPLGLLSDTANAVAGAEETFSLKGNGTAESPYEIRNKSDLEQMRDAVKNNLTPEDGKTAAKSAHYKLTADITDLGEWEPIGRKIPFTGTFDGNCHKISGMKLSRITAENNRSDSNYYGLFGQLGNGGTIKNLSVEGSADVASGWFVGLIAGSNDGSIENCFVKGTVNATLQFGGIAGVCSGTVKNCYADTTSNDAGSSKFGSITGYALSDADLSSNCYKDNSYPAVGIDVSASDKKAVALTAQEVENGKAAWLLRKEQGNSAPYWGQKLGEAKETAPKLSENDSDRVYRAAFMYSGEIVAEQFVNGSGKFTVPEGITFEKEGYTAGDKWYTQNAEDGKFDENTLYKFTETVNDDIILYSSQVPKKYTITLDAGEGTVEDDGWKKGEDGKYYKTYTKEDSDIELPTPSAPNEHVFAGWVESGALKEQETVTIKSGSTGDKTYTAVYRDAKGAVITVTMGEQTWQGLMTSFLIYTREQKASVKATAVDNIDKDVTLKYYIGNQAMTEDELKVLAENKWKAYKAGTDVEIAITAKTSYVYFKAQDSAGNVTFASSAGVVFDLNPPVISGISDGGSYCESIEFTANDAYLSRVTVGDTVIFDEAGVAASAESGITAVALGDKKFSVKFTDNSSAKVTITARDKAGNETVLSVTILGKHVEGRKVSEYTRQPSCVNFGEGYLNTYCKNCGELISREYRTWEKLEHRFSKPTVVSSELCGDTTTQRKCQVCGLIKTETVGGSHTWSTEYTVDREATCLNPGQKSKHCTKCGIPNPEDTVEIPTLEHIPGDADIETVKDATCTTDGGRMIIYRCKDCHSEIERTYELIPQKGHSFGEWIKIQTPSDPESGTMKRECSVCGYSETATYHTEHEWSTDKIIDKNPTCTTEGSKSYHCKNCGSTKDAEVIKSLGHKENEPVRETVIEPTCTQDGRHNEVVYCSVCNEVVSQKPVTEAALGHSFGEWEEVKTASGDVNEQRKCTVCGFAETRGMDLENHKWTADYIIDVAPTCTTEGSKSYHCTVCGLEKESEVIPALGHDWGEWETISSPDCDDEGTQQRSCKVCGEKETKGLSANGHVWNENYTVDKESTCTTEGSKSIHCSKCEAVKESEVIPALGHSFGEWEEVKTASGDVNEQRKCTVCGFAETRGMDLENHKWTTDYIIDVAPTCTTEGSKSYHCTVCGLEKESEVIPALGHDWGEWETISSPDCDDEGTQQRSCKVCGEKETKGLSANGHVWNENYTVDKEPTCLTDGSKSIHCSKCEAVKDSEAIPAPGHHTAAAERKGAKEATQTTDGYTGDVVCEKCGEIMEKGEIIPAGANVVVAEVGEGAPKVSLSIEEKAALENAALTDDEKKALSEGANVKIVLSVDNVTESVSESDKALAESVIGGKFKSGQFLNIEILKTINGNQTAVTQLNEEISLTIAVPEELKSNGRTYAIVRIHDGEAEILEDVDDSADTITFKTDKFSVYEIVYTDGASPETGFGITPIFAVLAAAAIVVLVKFKKRAKC